MVETFVKSSNDAHVVKKKVVGIKKLNEESPIKNTNKSDANVKKVNDTNTVPHARANVAVIRHNRAAGKSIKDAQITGSQKREEDPCADKQSESRTENELSDGNNISIAKQAESVFLQIGCFVGEGAVAGCKKIASMTSGSK